MLMSQRPTVSLLTVALIATFPPPTDAAWVEREAYLMGTTLRATVAAASRADGARAIEAAFEAVREVDRLLSTWRDDSEIARLNRAAPGASVRLSPALLSLLVEARAWSAATDGAFDPTVGALIDVYDLRGQGRKPVPAALAAARAATGFAGFALDVATASGRRLRAGSWIDTGGFGKGVALREARRALAKRGVMRGTLNFGGQVLALDAETDAGWRVPVAHPSRRDEAVAELALRNQSAATSSQSERFVETAGKRIGHILDPRTGRPVPAWGSVTVVADDPAVADILSTALFVLGPDAGMRWSEGRKDIAALFLVQRGARVDARWNRPMESLLVRHTLTTKGG